MKRKKELYIFRGVPGSGKSTLAEKVYKAYSGLVDIKWLEKDSFIPTSKEELYLDKETLDTGKAAYLADLDHALLNSEAIIVSNVFNKASEVLSLVKSALTVHDFDKVYIIEMLNSFESANCPAAKIQGFRDAWEEITIKDFNDFKPAPFYESNSVSYYKADAEGVDFEFASPNSVLSITQSFLSSINDHPLVD